MKRPCANCPFRSDHTGIRFASAGRALEIAMTALYHGFPCHKSADHLDGDEDYDTPSGFVFGEQTQHCAGYLIMKLKQGEDLPWPGIGNDGATLERIRQNVDMNAPVFGGLDEFVNASARRITHHTS